MASAVLSLVGQLLGIIARMSPPSDPITSMPELVCHCPYHSGMHDACLVPCVPLGREGPLGCQVGPYISLAMEKQLPPERVVLCIQHS